MNRHVSLFLTALCLSCLFLASCAKKTPAQKESIQSVTDLAGKKAAIMNGSIFEELTEPFVKNVTYLRFNDNPSAIQALRSGQVDVYLADEPVAQLAVAQFPQELRFVEVYAEDSYGIALRKNSPLTPKVRAIIQQMKKDGDLERLAEKWCRNVDESKKIPEVWNTNQNFDGSAGTLKYCSDPSSAPMAYTRGNELVGLELDVIHRVAHELNMKLETRPTAFDGLMPALIAGKADAVGGSMSITKERLEKVDFPEAHYVGGLSIVARIIPDESAEIKDFAELYGKRIGVMKGTTWETKVKEHFISSVPVPLQTMDEQQDALRKGTIQAFLADEPQAKKLVAQNKDFYILTKKLTHEDYAFLFNPSQTALRDGFNRELKSMRQDGTLQKLKQKWFTEGEEPTEMTPPLPNPPKGELVMAIDPEIPPYAYLRDKQIVGYEVELAQLIAAKLGYALKLKQMTWEEALNKVKIGAVPLTGGCVTITSERERDFLFSDKTCQGGIVVVTAKRDKAVQDDSLGQWLKNACIDLKNSFHRTLIVEDRWKMLAKGLKVTMIIALCAAILGTFLAGALCFMRRSNLAVLKQLARGFVSLMQGTPILVFLMILYYLVFANVEINPVLIAVIGFALNFAAYVSEMFRTGLEGIPKGQMEAALALGFTKPQAYCKVIFPQVLRHILPIYRGEFISLLKATSVVGYIAIEDLTQMSDNIRSRTYEAFFPLILTSIIYFLTAHVFVLALDRLSKRLDPVCRREKAKGENN